MRQAASRIAALQRQVPDANGPQEEGDTKKIQGVMAMVGALARQKKQKHAKSNKLGALTEDGKPLPVKMSLSIVSLVAIQTVKEQFTVSLYVKQQWPAPKTEEPEKLEEGTKNDLDWEPEWWPEFSIEGVAGDAALEDDRFRAFKDEKGSFVIERIYECVVDIKEPMDLAEFPFDIQDLTISLQLDDPMERVQLLPLATEKEMVRIGDENTLILSDFETFDEEPVTFRRIIAQALDGHYSEALEVNINMVRHSNYYMFNLVSILFMIASGVVGAWSIAIVNGEDEGNRIGFDLNIILAAVAFKFVTNSMLPAVSFLTLIDKYIFMCFIFVFTAFFFHILQGMLPVLMEPTIDTWSLYAYCVAWCCSNLLFSVHSQHVWRRRVDEIKAGKDDGHVTKQKKQGRKKKDVVKMKEPLDERQFAHARSTRIGTDLVSPLL